MTLDCLVKTMGIEKEENREQDGGLQVVEVTDFLLVEESLVV